MQSTTKIFALIALAIPLGLAACTDREDRASVTDMDTSENQITQGHTEDTAAGTGVGYDETTVEANRYPASTADSDYEKNRTHKMNKDKKNLKNVEMPLTDEQYQQAQNALKKLGYTVSSSPRGGPETTRAIQDFQNENDIPSTGSFDEMTLRRLGVLTDDRQPASVKPTR